MELIEFVDLFQKALDQVEDKYYGIDHQSNSLFARYDERVFCYEVYHQVRSLLDKFQGMHPDAKSPLYFQGELRKPIIRADLAKEHGVKTLRRRYIPDFLWHSPGNFRHQRLIIEVKSSPSISFKPISDDLTKIQEFMTRYGYEMGMFLVVNNSSDRMYRLLENPRNQLWIRENLPDRSRILFISKEKPGSETCSYFLNTITRP
jgi:hypothetical protein